MFPKAFCATRYISKNDKQDNKYTIIIVCPHCLRKFNDSSQSYLTHIDTCLGNMSYKYVFIFSM